MRGAHDLDTFLCVVWGLVGEGCGRIVNKGAGCVRSRLWIVQKMDD